MAQRKAFIDGLYQAKPSQTTRQAWLGSLPRTKEDAWRNTPEGRDAVDGVTGMDETSKKLVRWADDKGYGDVARLAVQAPAQLAYGAAGGTVKANAGIAQMLHDLTPVGFVDDVLHGGADKAWLNRAAKDGNATGHALMGRGVANYQTELGRGVGQGVSSAGATLPLMVAAGITKNPQFLSVGIGTQAAASSYPDYREQGLSPTEALLQSGGQGSLEVLTEMAPAGTLFKKVLPGSTIGKVGKGLVQYGAQEMAGEQVNTLAGNYLDAALVDARTNPNWRQDYVKGIPEQARDTALATVVMSPINVATAKGVYGVRENVDAMLQNRRQGGVPPQQARVHEGEELTPQQQQRAQAQRQAAQAAAMAMPVDADVVRHADAVVRQAIQDNRQDGMAMAQGVPGAAKVGGRDAMAQTLAMLRRHEGFAAKTYWDVNAHRLGYGTDTITDADGKVRKVKPGDTVTRADAERDLARRAKDFMQAARNTIGAAAFDRLPANAQAALTSVAYNYGSLDKLKTVVHAARSGDLPQLAQAIAARGVDNNGVNAKRRKAEAAAVLGTDTDSRYTGEALTDGMQPEYAQQDNDTQSAAEAMEEAARAQREATEGMQDEVHRMNKSQEAKQADEAQQARMDALMADEAAQQQAATAQAVQKPETTQAEAVTVAQKEDALADRWDGLSDGAVAQALVRAGYGDDKGGLSEAGAVLAESTWHHLPEVARSRLAPALRPQDVADGGYVRDMQALADKPVNQGQVVATGNEGAFSRSAMKDTEANIRRGREAMNKALLGKADVKRAMYRNDIGWVDFVWGDDYKGIQHIIKRRMDSDGMSRGEVVRMLADDVVKAIASGQTERRTESGKATRLYISHNGAGVSLVQRKGSNSWVLTAFQEYGNQAVEQMRGATHSALRNADPIRSRAEMGAPDTSTNLLQNPSDVNENADGQKTPGEEVKRQQRDKADAIRQELARVLGDKARLVDVVDVINQRPDDAMSLITSGVEGWFSGKTGKITLVAETLKPERAAWVAWHELGHRGVALAHFADYQDIMRQADKNATVRELADAIRHERKHYADRDFKDPALTHRAVAVEEALAELYAAWQTGDYDGLNTRYDVVVPEAARQGMKGYLQRVAERLKGVLAKVLGKPRESFSDADVFALLKTIDRHSTDDAGSLKGDERFSLNEDDGSDFARAVDDVVGGRHAPTNFIPMGTTPEVLKMLGVPITKVYIRGGVLHKAMGDKHAVSAEAMKQVPRQINNPVAVMRSAPTASQRGLVVLTELKEAGEPIIAALHVNRTAKGFEVVNIASVYGKNLHGLQNMLNYDVLYWHKTKGPHLVNAFGLQLPSKLRSDVSLSRANIKTDSDLAQYQGEHKFSRQDKKTEAASFESTAKQYGGREAYEQAKADGTTELDYRQWVQVRTPEFKQWFGDWEHDPANASKVVNDKTGEPLVVYHGTNALFTVFDKAFSNAAQYDNNAFFFTENENTARLFGDIKMPVFLNARKGLDEKRAARKRGESIEIDYLKAKNDPRNIWMVFSPNQIKSATDNTGAFDAGNDDIRFSRSPAADAKRDGAKEAANADRMRPEPAKPDWRDEGISERDMDMKDKAFDTRFFLEFNARKEWKAGRWVWDKMDKHLDGIYKRLGVRNKMHGDYVEAKHDYTAYMNTQAVHLRRMGGAFARFSPEHLALLSDVIERELTPEQLKAVQPELLALADTMRELMNQQADEMVLLKMLSPEARDKWRDVYLPRMYAKHIKNMQDMHLDKLQEAFVRSSGNAKMRGIKGDNLKHRGLYEHGVKHDDIDSWIEKGFEVVKDDGDTVTMWRDWTREEREHWGEVRDAGLRFATGFIASSRDIAQGRMFAQIASNPELASQAEKQGWVQVPVSVIPETGGVLRYGALAGMWVHPEVLDNLQYQFEMHSVADQMWRAYVGYWKMTKTVYNPVAHMNNTVSNISMLHLAGGNLTDLAMPFREMVKEANQTGSSELIAKAREVGLVGEAVDPRGMRDLWQGVDLSSNSKKNLIGSFIAASQARMNKIGKQIAALESKAGISKDNQARIARIVNLKKLAEDAYRMEDELFKLAVFDKALKRGMSPRAARNYALDYFFDYGDLAPTVRKLRDAKVIGLPFVSYSAKAIPAILRSAITRPHRYGVLVGLLYGLNAMMYAVLGGGADEDEERRLMPEWYKGYSPFGLKTIRLPNDANGNPQFLDLMRILPMGDMFDFTNQHGGVPMPQWGMFSTPLLNNAQAWIWNKDAFTGRAFVPEYYSGTRKMWERVKYTVQDNVPAGYHVTRILNGLRNHVDNDTPVAKVFDAMDITGRNRYGDMQSLKTALAGATGIKIRSFDMRQQKQRHDADLRRDAKYIESGIRRTRRDKSMSESAKRNEINRLEKERQGVLGRLFNKDDKGDD